MSKHDMPLVSILIAAYNSERFIHRAIKSALAQTYPNIEVVIRDDGSTDGTSDVIKSYKDPRIRHIRGENLGIPLGRNELLREAKGEFLTWLDDDDRYLPEKVRREAEFLIAHPDYAAVYCDTFYFFTGEPDRWYRYVQVHHHGKIFDQLLDLIFINNTAFMMRRSVVADIGPFREATGVVEDWEFFLRMARHGMQFGYVDEPLLVCELREDSHSRFEHQPIMKESVLATLQDMRSQMSEAERTRYQMDRRIQGKYRNLGLAYLAVGRKQDFYKAWRKAGNGWKWFLISRIAFCAVAVTPAAWITGLIRMAVRTKKKMNYVPIGNNDLKLT